MKTKIRIPIDFPVRPLRAATKAKNRATCGTCGLSWDDAIVTSWTPAPSARCPFEYFHMDDHLYNPVTLDGKCVECGERHA